MNNEEDFRPDPDELEENMVVADMSDLAAKRPILFPSFDAFKKKGGAKTAAAQQPVDVDAEDIKAAMKGALGAGLMIWLVYVIVFGAFIFLLTRFFKFF
jgi:hypothetical protein